MNKIIAEIIAGLIPCKMERNRWRGILRYGPINAYKLRRRMRQELPTPTCHLAVCAIAKNEGPYFVEWIEWHLSQGVEKFYIYDNESTDGTKDILQPYIDKGVVEYIDWPGYRMQLAAYDDCFKRHRLDTRWIAFIDIDEFIVPVKHNSIPDFLLDKTDAASVEINWLCYGSGGQKQKTPGGVMQRFKMHSLYTHPLNCWVKSIVNPRKVCCMTGCHEAARISGNAIDSHGNIITRHFRNRPSLHDVIRINHYAVKSYEEFVEKQARGRASGRKRSVPTEYFHQYDLNDIEE